MRLVWMILCHLAFVVICSVCAADSPPSADSPPTACPVPLGREFEATIWSRIASQKCLVCHQAGGEAESSQFLLIDPQKTDPGSRGEVARTNQALFVQLASQREQGESRLLLKARGELKHGGDVVLPIDSAEYRILSDFVNRLSEPVQPLAPEANAPSFFEGVTMLDDRRLLRRATLSLAGRLPTEAELATVSQQGAAAFPPILEAVMREDAFYERLREGFNDIFLTLGVDGNADQTCLSYEHFEKTRHWYQHYDLSHIADKDERQRTEWKIAAEYRKALLAEPLQLIEHIVREDHPFTEIVTADYIMVSPYTARGYGVFDEIKSRFQNPDDPQEYIPVKLKALVGRSRPEDQESATGFYPHAGLLSTFQYLTRYPTTETNRNRLRARMYYQHFLGVDVLELAARVSDAAAVTAKYKVPTMEAAECVVCHRTLDPVAGAFQDYWRFADQGVYGKRKEGWFSDMFAAGFEGEELPASERWRALQWLGERTARDPRFAIAMTEHVYYILTGRKVLLPPKDFDDPTYAARYRAYAQQRQATESIAAQFSQRGFNLKEIFKAWIATEFYRADGMSVVAADPCRHAELADVGIMRLLSPEQIERKIAAVFGEPWGRLKEREAATLYGGIDSKEVTDRAVDPSGAMGAIQRTLSNDLACRHVARDLAMPAAERKLFPHVDPGTLPGSSQESDQAIRRQIVHLHQRILGRDEPVDSAEIERTYHLFAGIVKEASETRGIEKRETYFCRPNRDHAGPEADDPHYTVRAWRAVVTYLLRRPEFLYE